MAKTDKQTQRDLVDRLRTLGLSKQLAKNIAQATTNVKGQLPDSARGALKEMIAKVEDLGIGGSKKRHPAEDGEDSSPTKKAKSKKSAKKAAKKPKAKQAKQAKKKAAKKAAKKLG